MNTPTPLHAARSPDMPECLRALVSSLNEGETVDPRRAAALLTALDLTLDDLEPWFAFDHPVEDSYGRKLIAGGANYELMLMSWAPGDYSAIHDHGMAEWGAVRYFGPADHAVFDEREGLLTLRKRMTMRPGDVFAVAQSLIHLMGNPTHGPIVSLHLYGRDESADAVTGSARIFDLLEDTIQRTDGGVFFCLPEHQVRRREPCPAADLPSRTLHHELMLDRLERMSASGPLPPLLEARRYRLLEARDQLASLRPLPVAP